MINSEKYSKSYFSEQDSCDFRRDISNERDDDTEETGFGDTGDTSL